jgi:hypothetical protein
LDPTSFKKLLDMATALREDLATERRQCQVRRPTKGKQRTSKKPAKRHAGLPFTVFISHSSDDSWAARQISRGVRGAGADYFLDVTSLDAGDDFEAKIKHAVRTCSELLVLLTRSSLGSPYVWMEIGAAWSRGKSIIVVLQGIKKPEIVGDPRIPAILKRLNLIDVNELDGYFKQLRTRVSQRKSYAS